MELNGAWYWHGARNDNNNFAEKLHENKSNCNHV